MTLDRERARQLGRRSGERRRRLTLADVERELPPMDTPEHNKRRLPAIFNLGLAGIVSAAMVGAQERVHREWREQHAFEIDRDRLKAAERRVAELEAQLARRRAL